MKNIFSRPTPGDAPGTPSYLKRAAFFGAGLLLLYLALQIMPTPATPEVASDEAGAVATSLTRASEPSFGPGMLIAALILVGGVVAAVALRRKTTTGTQTEYLQTIADMPITQDQRLRLVRVQDEVLLLGITSGQISVLQSYPADEFGDGGPANPNPAISPAFADMLRQASDRYRNLPRN